MTKYRLPIYTEGNRKKFVQFTTEQQDELVSHQDIEKL